MTEVQTCLLQCHRLACKPLTQKDSPFRFYIFWQWLIHLKKKEIIIGLIQFWKFWVTKMLSVWRVKMVNGVWFSTGTILFTLCE